jgi:hypothetical protein
MSFMWNWINLKSADKIELTEQIDYELNYNYFNYQKWLTEGKSETLH